VESIHGYVIFSAFLALGAIAIPLVFWRRLREHLAAVATVVCALFGVQVIVFRLTYREGPLVALSGLTFAVSALVAGGRIAMAIKDRPHRAIASHLEGIVEHDSTRVSGALVEECSPDWKEQLSSVKTDENGRFILPESTTGPVHFLRVTWAYGRSLRIRVHIKPDAPLLTVQMTTS
jgi:hypothetical protein